MDEKKGYYEPKNEYDKRDTDDMAATNYTEHAPNLQSTRINDEETATELTADDFDTDRAMDEVDEDGENANSAFGWIALALSVISFFWLPVILGAAGIIVGFIAKNRGADTLGNTAIIAGAASIIITLFILPFV